MVPDLGIIYKLKDIAKIYDGTHQTPNYRSSGIPFVSVENIDNIFEFNKYISKEAYELEFNKNHPIKGDILMTRIGDIGTPALITTDIDMGYYVSLARISMNNKVLPEYIYFYIQTPQFQHELWKKTIHVAFPKKINKEDIGKCKIKIFNTNKQKEISKILIAIESRILTQRKIIEDLNRLKMPINSQTFKQKGIIFKIKDICEIGRGRVISNEEIKKQQNPIYPVFSSQTQNNGIMGYLDSYEFDGEYITWTTDGANAGTIFYHNEKFNCTNVCGTLKVNNQNISAKYLSSILPYYVKKYVSKNLANPKLMNNTMSNIEVNIIPKIEQIKFINVLTSIEEKLNNEKSILELYIKQKEYLLNKLFI